MESKTTAAQPITITYRSAQTLLAAAALLGYNNNNSEAILREGKGALKLNYRNDGDPDTPLQAKRWFNEKLTPIEKPVFDFDGAQDAIKTIEGKSLESFDMNADASVLAKLYNVTGRVGQPMTLVFTADTLLDADGAPVKDLAAVLEKSFLEGAAPGAPWNPAV